MTHYTEQVGFPAIPINGTMQLRIRALSPTTDAEVADVVATQWLIYARDDTGSDLPDVYPPYSLADDGTGGA